eukprot:CAMPEP_0171066682 /NCGR_PEP_ID=MMETSP0766_2-20121228/7559_1 /TAXON_ID=439317 /ORGANISM="Gambierdiscus australes, Strain CAWD 149" /LENGTH=234 /DNA_ID=CAMNT_0011522871 /DNA_START=97 /DNA_END=799 /DNA_ORIENTATION=+
MAPRFCASQFGAPVQAILPSYFIRDANLVRQGHLPCVGRMVLLRQHRHEGGTDEVILYASFQTLAPAVPDVPKAASADAADLVLTILHVLQRGDEVHLSPVAVALGDAQGFHVKGSTSKGSTTWLVLGSVSWLALGTTCGAALRLGTWTSSLRSRCFTSGRRTSMALWVKAPTLPSVGLFARNAEGDLTGHTQNPDSTGGKSTVKHNNFIELQDCMATKNVNPRLRVRGLGRAL